MAQNPIYPPGFFPAPAPPPFRGNTFHHPQQVQAFGGHRAVDPRQHQGAGGRENFHHGPQPQPFQAQPFQGTADFNAPFPQQGTSTLAVSSKQVVFDANGAGVLTGVKKCEQAIERSTCIVRLAGPNMSKLNFLDDGIVVNPEKVLNLLLKTARGALMYDDPHEIIGGLLLPHLKCLPVMAVTSLWAEFVFGRFGQIKLRLSHFLATDKSDTAWTYDDCISALVNHDSLWAALVHVDAYSELTRTLRDRCKREWAFLHSKPIILRTLIERILTQFYTTLGQKSSNEDGSPIAIYGPWDDEMDGTIGVFTIFENTMAEQGPIDGNLLHRLENSMLFEEDALTKNRRRVNKNEDIYSYSEGSDGDEPTPSAKKKTKRSPRPQPALNTPATAARAKAAPREYFAPRDDPANELCLNDALKQFDLTEGCPKGTQCTRKHVQKIGDGSALLKEMAATKTSSPKLEELKAQLLASRRISAPTSGGSSSAAANAEVSAPAGGQRRSARKA